jgi:hypothetical protein
MFEQINNYMNKITGLEKMDVSIYKVRGEEVVLVEE